MDLLSPVREVFGLVLPLLDRLPAIRAVLGFGLVFFLPGFAWSLLFFEQLKLLERIALSLALSIVAVTLSVFFANRLLNIKLTGLNSVLIIIVVTILPIIAYYLNRVIKRKRA